MEDRLSPEAKAALDAVRQRLLYGEAKMDIAEEYRHATEFYEAENETLRAEIKRLHGIESAAKTAADIYEARIEQLEAALRSVIASEAHYELEPRGYIVPDQVMQWARAALAGKEEA